MTDDTSITHWMGNLKEGDNAAAIPIWHHFFDRLVRFAKNKMRGISTAISDEEDVALSVLKSVCIGLKAGRFSDLQSSESLWRMLLVICGRKISNQRAFLSRGKRNQQQQVALDSDDQLFADLISHEPTPELAMELTENMNRLLELLERDELKEIAILKMQGYTNQEISLQQKWSVSTVERKLRTIRTLWKNRYGIN